MYYYCDMGGSQDTEKSQNRLDTNKDYLVGNSAITSLFLFQPGHGVCQKPASLVADGQQNVEEEAWNGTDN